MTEANEEEKMFEDFRIANRKIEGKDRSTFLLPFQPIPIVDSTWVESTFDCRFYLGRDEDGMQRRNILFLGLAGSGRLSYYAPLKLKIRISSKNSRTLF